MISLRMFVEFIKRQDVDKIKTTLTERHYDVDQTDDVSTVQLTYVRVFSLPVYIHLYSPKW